jgi:hypothetical protein
MAPIRNVTAAGGASRWRGGKLVIDVRVRPRASRNEICGVQNGRLCVRTTAAPTDGKANQSVIRLVARYLGVAPSRVALQRGATSRDKQLVVAGPVRPPDGL